MFVLRPATLAFAPAPFSLLSRQADPKLTGVKDDDGRLPIHWAASSNQSDMVSALVGLKDFDADVQVCSARLPLCPLCRSRTPAGGRRS